MRKTYNQPNAAYFDKGNWLKMATRNSLWELRVKTTDNFSISSIVSLHLKSKTNRICHLKSDLMNVRWRID